MDDGYALRHHDVASFAAQFSELEDFVRKMPIHIIDDRIERHISAILHSASTILKSEGTSPAGKLLSSSIVALQNRLRNTHAEIQPNNRLSGTIVRIPEGQPFGFVQLSPTESLFFHRNSLSKPHDFSSLSVGDQIYFRIGENHEGPCAVEVDPVL